MNERPCQEQSLQNSQVQRKHPLEPPSHKPLMQCQHPLNFGGYKEQGPTKKPCTLDGSEEQSPTLPNKKPPGMRQQPYESTGVLRQPMRTSNDTVRDASNLSVVDSQPLGSRLHTLATLTAEMSSESHREPTGRAISSVHLNSASQTQASRKRKPPTPCARMSSLRWASLPRSKRCARTSKPLAAFKPWTAEEDKRLRDMVVRLGGDPNWDRS